MIRNFVKIISVCFLVIFTSGCATIPAAVVGCATTVAILSAIDYEEKTPAGKPKSPQTPTSYSKPKVKKSVTQPLRSVRATTTLGITQRSAASRPKPMITRSETDLIPALSPPPHPPRGNINISREKAQFLVREIERMIEVLFSELMSDPGDHSAELLEPGVLISWFDLERPESQAIYYRLLGIPTLRNTKLTRTKSEFYAISERERIKLRNHLIKVLRSLRQEVSWQSKFGIIGIHVSSLP